VRTILASVGRGSLNRSEDVRLVQELLNRYIRAPQPPLVVNGMVDSRTVAAIEAFQRHVVHMHRPDGRVEPGSHTFAALASQAEQPSTPHE
jgi:peptidoglycan hydrolase-like protein with peptidoglycan-binding domain